MKKRLSIKLAGHDFVTAWENNDKKEGDKTPDFKGDGVAVWVHEYEPQPSNNEEYIKE